MDRKERIYQYINSKEYIPLPKPELAAVLCVPDEDMEEFAQLLDELVAEGKIFLTKKKRYDSTARAGFIRGKLSCSARGRFGFVVPDDGGEDIFIVPNGFLDAYHSDTVLAVIDTKNPKNKRSEGHITRVIQRGNETLCGVIKSFDGEYFHIRPDSDKIYASLRVKIDDAMDADIGQRVLIRVTDYPKEGKIYGIIEKNLGSADVLKSSIEAIIEEHSIKQEFDEDTLKEAQASPKRVSQTEIGKRLDLRDKLIITIDGEDARDFDDAVSVEKCGDEYLLGVHIADVTEYVKEGTALDNEAFLRGTSVYLADRVIPMLPVELSNGICSLNPRVNRLTLSVFMRINQSGEVTLDKLTKTVIRSSERMTYNDVSDLLKNPTVQLLKKYEYLLPTLYDMRDAAQLLYNHRKNRGSINFDFPESHIKVDAEGNPVEIIKTERRISHKIIEEFMLAANETVAQLAFWAELPFVYRVHEPPSPDKTAEFNRFIMNFGYSLKGRFDKDNPIHPKAFCQVIEKIKGSDEEEMISTYMLRSLMKAEYKCENLGHFGLAARFYCHFTSPIRRYPDLIIHRILKCFIDGEDTSHFSNLIPAAAKNSSDTEIEAEYCERDVDDLMKAAYMQQFIGNEFEAVVSSVTGFGVFVRLENTVEGLIRLDSMKDDFYEFSEDERLVRGVRTQSEIRIGTRLSVILLNCDLITRRIDFVRSEDFSYSLFDDFRKKERLIPPKKGRKKSNRTTQKKNRRRRK